MLLKPKLTTQAHDHGNHMAFAINILVIMSLLLLPIVGPLGFGNSLVVKGAGSKGGGTGEPQGALGSTGEHREVFWVTRLPTPA